MGAPQSVAMLPAKMVWPFTGPPAGTPLSGMQSTRLGSKTPRSGSTAKRLWLAAAQAHTIVPRAAATAVGVEIAKFDWRARTSATEACAIAARSLPTARCRMTTRLWFCRSNSSLLRSRRLFSASTTVLVSGKASSAEAPENARMSSPSTRWAPTTAGIHCVCPLRRISTRPTTRFSSALTAGCCACDG